MIRFPKNFISKYKNKFYWHIMPPLVDRLVRLTCLTARRRIKKGECFNLLIDNSVIGYSVTHETAWIKTGWSDELQCEYGYSARIPSSF